MNPRVCGLSGPFEGVTLSMASAELSVGREASNHLWIPDPVLSRRHCLLTREGDQFFIRDLAGLNGQFGPDFV